ncbi:MAG: response regulator [Candidatus Cloacimonetes bacterium]|nr:response regulator [Candidatus Cloacimonadota bacterium]
MNKLLLIIEDNAENFYMMHFLLTKNGWDIVNAETGRSGIEKALHYKPYGILLDIQLPEMDGYEVARVLRNNSELVNIPIIAVTSYAMAGDRENILAAGANGYIEKPINPDTFVTEIEQYLADYYKETK